MLPSGAIAIALLLSLIPGWRFLRRTEASRRPRNLSSLQEILELVTVGLLTTGVAIGAGLLLWPDLLLDRDFPAETHGEVRLYVGLAFATLSTATLLAEVAAWFVRRAHPAPKSEFNIGVWWSVMRPEAVPDGHLPYIAIERSDGVTVEGVLHTYTWSPDVTHRDVALRKPVKFTQPAGRRIWRPGPASVTRRVPYDFVVVPGVEIKHIALKYTPQ